MNAYHVRAVAGSVILGAGLFLLAGCNNGSSSSSPGPQPTAWSAPNLRIPSEATHSSHASVFSAPSSSYLERGAACIPYVAASRQSTA